MDAEWEKQFEDHRKRVKETAKLIIDNSEDQEPSDDLLNKLRDVVIQSVVMKTQISKLRAVVENLMRQVDNTEDFENVHISELHSIESEKDVATPTLNYEAEFNRLLASLQQDAEDGEIMSQPSQAVSVDPWTKRPIERPVRSKICGHVYDKASILNITSKKRDFKCPYIGCKVRVNLNDLDYD